MPKAVSCTNDDYHNYKKRIRTQIVENLKYPDIAVKYKLEGSGVVKFSFSMKDLNPESIEIVQSTGFNTLDLAIIESVNTEKLPIIACKSEYEVFNITAPITFKIP